MNPKTIEIRTRCGKTFEMSVRDLTDWQLDRLLEQNADRADIDPAEIDLLRKEQAWRREAASEHTFADTNRHLVEVPDSFAVARWSRNADVATIARCILGTLKYEPHAVDTTVLRWALEGVIDHTERGGTVQKQEETTMDARERIARRIAENQLLATLERRRLEIQRQRGDQMTVKQWLAIRKEAALKIDPETAEVTWIYAWTLDPYGVHPDLPEECQQAGREYFARSPGSDVWVDFGDLPDATRDAFEERRCRADRAHQELE